MKRNYPFFILVFVLIPIFSQSQNIHLKRKLNWQENRNFHHYLDKNNIISGQYLFFEDARYFDNQTQLPYYYEIIPLNSAQNYSVHLENKEFDRVAEETVLNDEAKNTLGEEISVKSGLRFERSKPFMQLRFIPIRRNPVTGNFERLVAFDIVLEEEQETRKRHVPESLEESAPSVLSKGKWVKIRVKKNGIHKLDFSKLKDLGFDRPGHIKIYGSSCGLLNVSNDTTKDYRLKQVPVAYLKGADNEFNKGDKILFYARNTHKWEYDRNRDFFYRKTHPYTEYGYYYLTDNQENLREITNLEAPSGEPVTEISTFRDYMHHEKRNRNLIKSGKEWVGEYFDVKLQYGFEFGFPNIDKDSPVKVKGDFVSRSSYRSSFSVASRDNGIVTVDIPSVTYNFTGAYARSKTGYGQFFPESEQFTLQVNYSKGTPSAEGWLNYLTVNAVRELRMNDNQLHFRYKSPDESKVVKLRLLDAPENLEVWEVTDNREIRKINHLNQEGNDVTFNIRADTLYREFIAFNHKEYYNPEYFREIDNQDLHGMGPQDMMVVTKERFWEQAQDIADLHRNRDGFNVAVVTDKQVYNEFSAGKPDPSAIRNFLRTVYRKSVGEDSLKYLLLFGDGSYDNKNSGDSPFLMTYQSDESFNYSRSFVSDDFYGLLDPGDNIEKSPSGLIDIGIGRFPVRDEKEAREVVRKAERYMNTNNWGAWMNKICFVADDQDNNLHMRDADKLASYVSSNYPKFDIRKIYFDSYEQQTTATGSVYPEVSEEINENINNGILLFNYVGHGGEHHLAHERVLTKDDIDIWRNADKLPLFMTATCEFTRFDDPNYVSAGEEVFLKPQGGSIASFSTTRLVYASLNYNLNRTFYEYIFEKDYKGEPRRFGDIVRLTKNYAGSSNNKRNFSLFGDPALQLPIGEYCVQTDSIVENDNQVTDTINALDKITIHGKIVDNKDKVVEDFDGRLNVKLFDKLRTLTTRGNDGEQPFKYENRDNMLFAGESSVANGHFKSEFIVPKEILPGIEKGKILYMGTGNKGIAQDYHNEVYVGGYSERVLNDKQGPEIELYMNDRDFVSGGITSEDPVLYARLRDSSGINVSSAGIGHNITMVLDKNTQDKKVLNPYYNAEKNSYKAGEVKYKMSNLEKGKHELSLKVWDINENSSSASLEFQVTGSNNLKINKVLNYPNPFTQNTAFYFEHNRPGTSLDVLIQVFTVSGKLVKTIRRNIQTDGFRAGPIRWNGRDDFGDKIGKGVYLYKIKIRSSDGDFAEKIQKLVILK
jgi:hypothetical protein